MGDQLSWYEHLPCKQGVTSSILVSSTSLGCEFFITRYISRINSAGRVPSLQVGSRRSESCIRDQQSVPTLNETRRLCGVARKETPFPREKCSSPSRERQFQRLSFSQNKWVYIEGLVIHKTKCLASDAACAERPSAKCDYINGDGLIYSSVLWGEFGREHSGAVIRSQPFRLHMLQYPNGRGRRFKNVVLQVRVLCVAPFIRLKIPY